MFHRIIHDHWTEVIPIVGFALTFTVFLLALLRAFLMKKSQCHQLAQLPLDQEIAITPPSAPSAPKPPSCRCDQNCGCCLKKSLSPHEAKPQTLTDN